jgi:hypothetical protein
VFIHGVVDQHPHRGRRLPRGADARERHAEVECVDARVYGVCLGRTPPQGPRLEDGLRVELQRLGVHALPRGPLKALPQRGGVGMRRAVDLVGETRVRERARGGGREGGAGSEAVLGVCGCGAFAFARGEVVCVDHVVRELPGVARLGPRAAPADDRRHPARAQEAGRRGRIAGLHVGDGGDDLVQARQRLSRSGSRGGSVPVPVGGGVSHRPGPER